MDKLSYSEPLMQCWKAYRGDEMSAFNIVAQSAESTVVTECKPQVKRSDTYRSEVELEKKFIRLLTIKELETYAG